MKINMKGGSVNIGGRIFKRGGNVNSLHDDDFETTMWEHAIDDGMFIPTTVEEVEKMEGILKGENLLDEKKLPSVDAILSPHEKAAMKLNEYRKDWMSDDQYECYEFLADLFFGWHHVHGKLHEWGDGIKLNTKQFGSFATFDFDGLTRAVVMAHDRMIRFEINPSGPGMLALICSKRRSREGRMYERHPTMEQAIGAIRNP